MAQPDDVELYRSFATELLATTFQGNMSAMARAMGFQSTNLYRFIKKKEGGLSTKYAKVLCEVGGKPYPLTHTATSVPPPARVAPVAVLRSAPTKDDLDKVLDLFGKDFSGATAGAARGSIASGEIRSLSPKEWLTALGELDNSLTKWVEKYKPIEIEDPADLLYPRKA